jgi:phosphomannomutase
MQQALAAGHRRIVAWEANGGFLTGTALEWGHGRLGALPTRDAMLPLLCALVRSAERAVPISHIFRELPARRTGSGLVDGVPTDASQAALAALRPADPATVELWFAGAIPPHAPGAAGPDALRLRARVAALFEPLPELGAIHWLNFLDGLRIGFEHGDVAHLRPSGNAPQLRIYALSDTAARAERIVAVATRPDDGVIARLLCEAGA